MQPTTVSPIIPFLIPFITAFLGILLGIILQRYASRNVLIKSNIVYNPLGTSTADPYWGNIEITHEGRHTNHLNLITADLINDSTKNFKDMIVDAWVTQGNQILALTANYVGTGVAIMLEPGYHSDYKDVLERLAAGAKEKELNPSHTIPEKLNRDLMYVQENKKFILPAFNRGTTVKIIFLVENFSGQIPVLRLGILHEGVKLVPLPDPEAEKRKELKGLLIYGLIVYAGCSAYLYYRYSSSLKALILSTILGLFYGLIGLFIYRTVRFIRRAVS